MIHHTSEAEVVGHDGSLRLKKAKAIDAIFICKGTGCGIHRHDFNSVRSFSVIIMPLTK